MSDCERFAQIAQDKWVTVSKSLRSLMSKERPWENRTKNEWFAYKNLTNIVFFGRFIVRFFYRAICSFPFFNERCEQMAQVAHQKWMMWATCSETMSKWLRSLTKNERMSESLMVAHKKWATWASCSFFWVNRSFAHFFAKNKRFAQKTDEQIPNPAYCSSTVNLFTWGGGQCVQIVKYYTWTTYTVNICFVQ